MLRLCAAVLLACAGAGCLEPQTEDQAGYSRNLLPSDATVKSGASDTIISRKIDMGDGVSMGKATPKSGWAAGRAIRYWDLGVARGTALPAYQLARCDAEGRPLEDGVIDHPMLVDAIPGDADYTQFWGIYYACVTPEYRGERVTSLLALNDAYEMGLLTEPKEPLAWKHCPLVSDGVVLEEAPEGLGWTRTAYYRGYAINYVDFGGQGSVVASMGKTVSTGNVYEIVKQGSTKIERVVFATAAFNEDGTRSEKYTPVWTIVNVTVAAAADVMTFAQESDIATQNMDRTFTKASDSVISVTASMNRVARPVMFGGGEP
jgi:hypothetical protein